MYSSEASQDRQIKQVITNNALTVAPILVAVVQSFLVNQFFDKSAKFLGGRLICTCLNQKIQLQMIKE